MGPAALAAAFALAVAPPVEPSSESPPEMSVMVVETTGHHRERGLYYPPGAGPDFLPWHAYFDMRVRIAEHLWGRRYARISNMLYVAHAAYVPSVSVLVIAEPRNGGSGFFVRWYTAHKDEDGRFCVPSGVVTELRVQPAFTRARVRRDGADELLCV